MVNVFKIFAQVCGDTNVKAASDMLSKVVKGQPRGFKKKFYKNMSLFMSNPENAKAKEFIQHSVENSREVSRSIDLQAKECLMNARNRAEQLFKPEPWEIAEYGIERCNISQKNCIESLVNEAKVGFDATIGARKKMTAMPIYNNIIIPIRTNHKINQICANAREDLKHLEIKLPEIKFSGAEIEEMTKSIKKDYCQSMKTLFGRTITYPFNKLVSKIAPKNTKMLLEGVIDKPKSEFGKAYYSRLVKTKGLSGRAPSKFVVTSESAGFRVEELFGQNVNKCEGGMNPLNNSMQFTREFSILPRSIQTNLLTHELKHFEQFDSIIRTFGVERYIEALKIQNVNRLKSLKEYSSKSEKELKIIVENLFKNENLEETIRNSFAHSIKAEKINPFSDAGIKAKGYLEALENYVAPERGIITKTSKEYYKNLLEKEAYATGKKTGFWTSFFERLNLKEL